MDIVKSLGKWFGISSSLIVCLVMISAIFNIGEPCACGTMRELLSDKLRDEYSPWRLLSTTTEIEQAFLKKFEGRQLSVFAPTNDITRTERTGTRIISSRFCEGTTSQVNCKYVLEKGVVREKSVLVSLFLNSSGKVEQVKASDTEVWYWKTLFGFSLMFVVLIIFIGILSGKLRLTRSLVAVILIVFGILSLL